MGPRQCSFSFQKKFTFLSTFRWTARKGWDVLLEAYWAAFARDDDVVLKLRTYQAGWERTPGGPKGAAARLARYEADDKLAYTL